MGYRSFMSKIKAHPGVESAHDERERDHKGRLVGVVVICLKPGYSFSFHQSGGGFETLQEALSAVNGIYHYTGQNPYFAREGEQGEFQVIHV